MKQVTILLPEDLVQHAERSAEVQGIPFDELVRESLVSQLGWPKRPRNEDPFFDLDIAYDGPTPPDLAINHDKYLYGDDD